MEFVQSDSGFIDFKKCRCYICNVSFFENSINVWIRQTDGQGRKNNKFGGKNMKFILDSGSSIKQEEAKSYGVDILPLKLLFDEQEYLDGIDISMEEFYHKLIEEGKFPKTSLPPLEETEKLVNSYTEQGEDVMIFTISSEISGTCNTMRMLFSENPKVRVIDSRMAVGGMRFLLEEAMKYQEESLDFVEEKVNALIPRIKTMAIPETLDYLLRGGRLSKAGWMIGSLLSIKPIIGFKDGKVDVMAKKRGLKQAMQTLAASLTELNCDKEYGIIASYTYQRENLDLVIEMAGEEWKPHMRVFDNLDPAIACHWGPNAFGFIFVCKE